MMYQTERVVSQKTRVKEHLESGNPITPIAALNLYGCFRLAAIIHTLKKYEGMNIKTEIRKSDGKKWAGINAKEGKVSDMLSQNIIEPLVVKEQIIKSATETASMILRIDDVIATAGIQASSPGNSMAGA